MGKSAENSGKAKKWAIFTAIVVLVAVIVVVIILAVPPNTYNAVEMLNRTSSSSYLTVYSEQVEFANFRTKVSTSAVVGYTQELYDIEKTAKAIDIILDFHNDNLVFAKENKNLNKNYKSIKEGLQDAKDIQKKLVNIVSKTNKLSDSSSTYLQSAIVDYREQYLKYLKACKRAIGGLENAYNGSQGKVLYINQASTLILNTVNDYMDVLVSQYNDLVKADLKGGNMTAYTQEYAQLGIKAKTDNFYKFVVSNVQNGFVDDTYNYYFESTVKQQYDELNEFFTLYSEKNTKPLIESMETVGTQNVITKTYDGVSDSNGVFEKMCKFLKGGL